MAVAVVANIASRPIVGIAPEPIPAGFDGFHPLRLLAQRDTWNAVEIGLLLQAARIRVEGSRILEQPMHVEIPERRKDEQRLERQLLALHRSAGPRMQRQHYRMRLCA